MVVNITMTVHIRKYKKNDMDLVILAINSHISHLEKSIVSEMSAGLKVVFASGTPTGGLWKSTNK
jgi:hypothetical protein